MERQAQEIIVPTSEGGLRLDVYLSTALADQVSRSQVKRLVEEGFVRVNDRQVSAHYKVKAADRIVFSLGRAPEMRAAAEEIPLTILYEDEQVLVIDKPAGMVVHPANGNHEHTLVNALLFHVRSLNESPDPVRPGIVHRLDKDTSGVMVIAKNDAAHRGLARQFKDHTIERCYHTVVQGIMEHEEGLCEEPVGRAFLNRKKIVIRPTGGKEAATFFRVIRRFRRHTLVGVYPRTGRTHQIRVHMAYLGHPVVGDSLYGRPSALITRQALHAKSLGFRHPVTRERLFFESGLPSDMVQLLSALEQED